MQNADAGDQNLTLMEAMERSKIIEVLKETGGNKLKRPGASASEGRPLQ
jgi:hypothetical protein